MSVLSPFPYRSFFPLPNYFVAFPEAYSLFQEQPEFFYLMPREGNDYPSALPCQTSANTSHGISSIRQKQWGNKFIFSSSCLLFLCLWISHLLTLDEGFFPVPSPKLQTKWQCLSAVLPNRQTVENILALLTEEKYWWKRPGFSDRSQNSYRLKNKTKQTPNQKVIVYDSPEAAKNLKQLFFWTSLKDCLMIL